MVCYHCGGTTDVTNSRPQKRANQVWRRRRCTLCDTVFTSLEGIDYATTLTVQRGANRHDLSPLQRDRLFLSLHKSLGHRPDALADAGHLTATVLNKLAGQAADSIISTNQIVQTVSVMLSRFDSLAAQHYQALHRLR